MNDFSSTAFLRFMDLYEMDPDLAAQYPFNLAAVQGLKDQLDFHENVTFLVGENGSGKSTLLEALAVQQGFNAEGGTKNFNFATEESHSELHKHLRVSKGFQNPKNGFFLRAESFYNVASEVDNLGYAGSYGGKSLHEQSHGESFFALMQNRFGANGLYILDEPEAALSPNRQMAMLTLLHQLVLQGCQFIIATHSPILLSYPDSKIYEIQSNAIKTVDYEQTEIFNISKYFLCNYKSILEDLLKDE